MQPSDLNQRLSKIATLWTVVFRAHEGGADSAQEARNRLMLRYSGAVYRYLLGAVRDPEAAGDLCQEFALRFLRGDFRRAAPERGRFRDYVKSALINLVTIITALKRPSRGLWPRERPNRPPRRRSACPRT